MTLETQKSHTDFRQLGLGSTPRDGEVCYNTAGPGAVCSLKQHPQRERPQVLKCLHSEIPNNTEKGAETPKEPGH